MKKKIQINIYDTDLVWKGMIEDVNYLIHRSSWHEIYNSELKISKTAQNVEELQIGRILVINNQLAKALIIEDMSTSIKDQYWTIVCIPLKGLLNYRIVHVTDTPSYSLKTQAEVMMGIANANLVTQTRDIDRKFMNSIGTKNLFSIASLKTYGASITFSIDWNTGYLGESLTDISKMNTTGNYPIGWNIYLNSAFDGFTLDTYQATNRHVNQSINPPVVFSEEYGNIEDANYTQSTKDMRNAIYMEWDLGGTAKTTEVEKGTPKGFNRKELIYDSSKSTDPDILNEGQTELNKRLIIENFTGEILDNENTMSTYGKDWFLGDIVTIQSKAIKKNQLISMDVQVIRIEEVYDNGYYSIVATFSEGKMTLLNLIKNAINAIYKK